jgi:hypothetical protein
MPRTVCRDGLTLALVMSRGGWMVEVGKKAAEEYPRRRMECSSDGGDSQLNGVEEWMMSGSGTVTS